jgi:hypothetical protein
MTIKHLVYLSEEGSLTRTRSGDITNIGGTNSPSFTVNGKGLLFDDGSSTSGNLGLTLQNIYDNSIPANIVLSTGKDLTFFNQNSSKYLKIDATTGAVTITGDLAVLGNTTIITSNTETASHWVINPTSSTVSALVIEPAIGVVPNVDIVNIKQLNGGGSIFKIDKTGLVTLNSLDIVNNLTISGTINSVNINTLADSVSSHLFFSTALKHAASEVSITPLSEIPAALNVQQALDGINHSLQNINAGLVGIQGLEFFQLVPSTNWIINHNQNTKRIQITVWDETDEVIFADRISITNVNNVNIRFGSPQSGRAILMCF